MPPHLRDIHNNGTHRAPQLLRCGNLRAEPHDVVYPVYDEGDLLCILEFENVRYVDFANAYFLHHQHINGSASKEGQLRSNDDPFLLTSCRPTIDTADNGCQLPFRAPTHHYRPRSSDSTIGKQPSSRSTSSSSGGSSLSSHIRRARRALNRMRRGLQPGVELLRPVARSLRKIGKRSCEHFQERKQVDREVDLGVFFYD